MTCALQGRKGISRSEIAAFFTDNQDGQQDAQNGREHLVVYRVNTENGAMYACIFAAGALEYAAQRQSLAENRPHIWPNAHILQIGRASCRERV